VRCNLFHGEKGVHIDEIQKAEGFDRISLLDDAVDLLLVNDDTKHHYLLLASNVNRLFKAILPDARANAFGVPRKAIAVIAEKIRSLSPEVDISDVMEDVDDLLDDSIAPLGYVIRDGPAGNGVEKIYDLSKIDFEGLAKRFEKSRKRIEAEKLRGMLNQKINRMVRLNKSRIDYLEKFKEMIEEYNAGSSNIDVFYAKLLDFAKNLSEEEQRGISENLSEEELAIFDLLTKPAIKLSKKEEKQVKEVAKELLDTLKAERLVLDWRKRQRTRAAVQLTIEKKLDHLPSIYSTDLYKQKCAQVYHHVYEAYYGLGRSVYSLAC
jgi:type I restriction enzyme R subunit